MKLRFADCVVDLRARQLERQGTIVPLEPKVYELLEALIKHRPAVVTSQELDELLWPKVYVGRASLARLVSELRSALGDTPQGARIIRTVYKSGYAFCADVAPVASRSASSAMIELVWKKHVFLLTEGENLAGRDEACAVVIDGSTVSRQHARLVVIAETATVEDLGSTNGTLVNGSRISAPTPLSPGDELSLGSELLQVRRRKAHAPTVKVDEAKKLVDPLSGN
jgi:DNA-binding winged helix-turn-helix (wHTH) protein